MKFRIFTVDAFTSKPFEGNPAAVVVQDDELSESTMQSLASEMNISETCYLKKPKEQCVNDFSWKTSNRFGLRWFTPKNEVILCGHATLASAHVLFKCIENTSQTLEFETLSGVLFAHRGESGKISLDFPGRMPRQLTPPEENDVKKVVDEVAKDLSVEEVVVSPEARKLLIRLSDQTTSDQLSSLSPSSQKLLEYHDGSLFLGVIVTVIGDSAHADNCGFKNFGDHHFVSRYFAAWNGIHEDPVTGSAHTVLTPYWASKLGLKTMKARQCSKRGGDLIVNLRDDGRVDITGEAVTVVEGTVTI